MPNFSQFRNPRPNIRRAPVVGNGDVLSPQQVNQYNAQQNINRNAEVMDGAPTGAYDQRPRSQSQSSGMPRGLVNPRPVSKYGASTPTPRTKTPTGIATTGTPVYHVQRPDGALIPVAAISGDRALINQGGKFISPSTGKRYLADPTSPTGMRDIGTEADEIAAKQAAAQAKAAAKAQAEATKAAEKGAEDAQKRSNAEKTNALMAQGRKYFLDRVTGEPKPLQSEEEWKAAQAEKGAKLQEAAATKTRRAQLAKLEFDAAQVNIKDKELDDADEAVASAKEAIAAARTQAGMTEEDAYTKPFDEAELSTPQGAALTAAEAKKKELQDKIATRDALKQQIAEAKLRIENPEAYAQVMAEKVKGEAPEALDAREKESAAQIEATKAEITAKKQKLDAEEQRLAQSLAIAQKRYDEAKTTGNPAILSTAGEALQEIEAEAQAFEEKSQALRDEIATEVDEVNRDVQHLGIVSTEKASRRKNAIDDTANAFESALPGMGTELRSVLADGEARTKALRAKYKGREDAPEAKAAFEALQSDISGKTKLIEQQVRDSTTEKQSVRTAAGIAASKYQQGEDKLTKESPTGKFGAQFTMSQKDWNAAQAKTQEGWQARKLEAIKAAGLDPKNKEHVAAFDDAAAVSGMAPIKSDLTKPLKAVSADTVRTLSDGSIAVNPSLIHNADRYLEAVELSDGTPEAKADAVAALPGLQLGTAKALLPALKSMMDVPGLESFAKWTAANKPEGDEIQQADAYLKAMQVRGYWSKLVDSVGRNAIAGLAYDLPAMIVGTAGLVTGSETLSKLAGESTIGGQRLTQTIGAEGGESDLSTKILAQTARMAGPMAAQVLLTRGLGGGQLAIYGGAAAQTAGLQYASTYQAAREAGKTHGEAWRQVAPWAIGSGLVTAMLTAAGGKSGFEKLMQKGGDKAAQAGNTFWQRLKGATAAITKEAAAEIPEELPDELFSQISEALASDPDADVTQIVAQFIQDAPSLIGSVALMGGAGGIPDARRALKGGQDTEATTPDGPLPEDVAGVQASIAAFSPTTPEAIQAMPAVVRTGPKNQLPSEITAKARAAMGGVAKIASGEITKPSQLTETQMRALGVKLDKGGKLVSAGGANAPAPLIYTRPDKAGNDQIVITDEARTWLQGALPDLAIGQSEAERIQAIENPPAPDLDSKGRPMAVSDWDWEERGVRRRKATDAWFDGGMANPDVNAAFGRAAQVGGEDLATHGMAKFGTLSGAFDALIGLLTSNVDPKRGIGGLYTAPMAVSKGSAAAMAGTTGGGTSYRDGPFILVQSAAESKKGRGIKDMASVQAVLVNDANAGQIDAIRKAIQAVRPDIIVELYSQADVVAAKLTGKKPKKQKPVAETAPVTESPAPAATQEAARKAVKDWHANVRNRWNADFQEEAAMVNPAFNAVEQEGFDVQAHGMAKLNPTQAIDALLAMFEKGLDPNRGREGAKGTLDTANLTNPNSQNGGMTAGGAAYRDGAFILVQKQGPQSGKGISDMSQVAAVLVNPAMAAAIPAIQAALPGVLVTSMENVADAIKAAKAPAATPTKPATSPSTEATTPSKLPRELASAKPRYSYGEKQFTLEFENDADRAAYITAQEKPSKRDADYLAFAMQSTGLTEPQVRAHGAKVRAYIKSHAATGKGGTAILIPSQTSSTTVPQADKKADIPAPEITPTAGETTDAIRDVNAVVYDLRSSETGEALDLDQIEMALDNAERRLQKGQAIDWPVDRTWLPNVSTASVQALKELVGSMEGIGAMRQRIQELRQQESAAAPTAGETFAEPAKLPAKGGELIAQADARMRAVVEAMDDTQKPKAKAAIKAVLDGLRRYNGHIPIVLTDDPNLDFAWLPNEAALAINPETAIARFAADATDAKNAAAQATQFFRHELIHKFVVEQLGNARVMDIWNQLPPEVQSQVQQAYSVRLLAKGQTPRILNQYSGGHEYYRAMLEAMKDGTMTEQVIGQDLADKWRKFLDDVLSLLRDLRKQFASIKSESARNDLIKQVDQDIRLVSDALDAFEKSIAPSEKPAQTPNTEGESTSGKPVEGSSTTVAPTVSRKREKKSSAKKEPQKPEGPTVQIGDTIIDSQGMMGPVIGFENGVPIMGMEGENEGDIDPQAAVGGWKLEQKAAPPTPAEQAPEQGGQFAAEDKAAFASLAEGLFASPTAPVQTFKAPIPPAKLGGFITLATKLASREGEQRVDSPAKVAAFIDEALPGGKARALSDAFWSAIRMTNPALPAGEVDWQSVYAELDQPAEAQEPVSPEATISPEAKSEQGAAPASNSVPVSEQYMNEINRLLRKKKAAMIAGNGDLVDSLEDQIEQLRATVPMPTQAPASANEQDEAISLEELGDELHALGAGENTWMKARSPRGPKGTSTDDMPSRQDIEDLAKKRLTDDEWQKLSQDYEDGREVRGSIIATEAAPASAKVVTPEMIASKVEELLRAPTKTTKKPAVAFGSQTEERAFKSGFEAATQKQGKMPPPEKTGLSPKDRKWDDAWRKGWASGQTFVRSLPDTPATAEAKVEEQVQTIAATEGQRDAKEIKSDIVAALEKAMAERDPANVKLVTFQIPGDGTFKIYDSADNIKTLMARVKRLPTKIVPANAPSVTSDANLQSLAASIARASDSGDILAWVTNAANADEWAMKVVSAVRAKDAALVKRAEDRLAQTMAEPAQEATPAEESPEMAAEPKSPADLIRQHLDEDDATSALAVFDGMTKDEINKTALAVFGRGFYNNTKAEMLTALKQWLPDSTKSVMMALAKQSAIASAKRALKTAKENQNRHAEGILGMPTTEQAFQSVSDEEGKDPHGIGKEAVAKAWQKEVDDAQAKVDELEGEPAAPAVEETAPEVAATKPKDGIADFGEKLGGARKDKAATVNEELSDDEIAGKTLSEIWPKSEIASIEDDELAAYATTLRSVIPTKPQKGYKLNAWVAKVKTVKELMRFAAEKGVPEMISMLRSTKYNLGGFADKVVLLQGVPREHWDRIGNVSNYPDAYRYGEGAGNMTKIPSPHAEAEVDGRRVRADNLDALLEAVVGKVSEGKAATKMQFEVRGRTGKWGINKKGDPLYRKLKVFEDSKEALNYITTNHADLVTAWDGVKERDNIKETDLRKSENRPRTAEDWRKGKDATPEMFTKAFGFRGVEFGNWVSQGKNAKERQGMMNEAYDALHDLASILNIPTKALSLDGQIGLGFGSRGHGWASAHYEPGNLVINLTKTRGAGSLAHELFHAFDHYFGRFRGVSIKNNAGVYITNEPETRYVNTKTGHSLSVKRWNEIKDGRGRINNEADWKLQEGVRPEVEEAFTALVKALDESPMAKRASLNDKGKEGYWGSTIERAARSFENYVIFKMQQKGYQNDYLANVVTIEDFVRDPGRYPYLLDEEIEPVAKAFDDLFATIKTRETDRGVALFASPTAPARPIATVIQSFEAAFPTFSTYMDENQTPAARKEALRKIVKAESADVQAWREFTNLDPEQALPEDAEAIREAKELLPEVEKIGELSEVVTRIESSGVEMFASEKNGIIRLSKIIVPKADRGKGVGTQAMQGLIRYADATNQQIALTPSSDFGGSKTRLEKFYRGLGFRAYKGYAVQEKLIRDPESKSTPPAAPKVSIPDIHAAFVQAKRQQGTDSPTIRAVFDAAKSKNPRLSRQEFVSAIRNGHYTGLVTLRDGQGSIHVGGKGAMSLLPITDAEIIDAAENATETPEAILADWAATEDVQQEALRASPTNPQNPNTTEIYELRQTLDAPPDVFPIPPERLSREAESLLRWATENGRIIDESAIRDATNRHDGLGGGEEHDVWLPSQAGGRVVKLTKGKLWGIQHSLARYLDTLAESNNRFGDDIRLEGVVIRDGWPHILISQPFYEGSAANQKEIDAYFTDAGYGPFRNLDAMYTNAAGDLMYDAFGRNVFKLADGSIMPIDVQVKVAIQKPLQASPTSSRDATYLQAVSEGDMEKAQRMVDAAAKAAGYNVGPVIHGTKKKFTVFNKRKIKARFDKSLGFHFTSSLREAVVYATDLNRGEYFGRKGGEIPIKGSENLIRAFLKTSNPLAIDTKFPAASMELDINTSEVESTLEKAASSGSPHDAIIVNSNEGEWRHQNVVVFDPNQIKSADPVTRDERGRVIPLSQRFNSESDSILYASPTPRNVANQATTPEVRRVWDEMNRTYEDTELEVMRYKEVNDAIDNILVDEDQAQLLYDQITEKVNRGLLLTVEEDIARRKMAEVLVIGTRDGNDENRIKGVKLFSADQKEASDNARKLGSRVDKMQTPLQRLNHAMRHIIAPSPTVVRNRLADVWGKNEKLKAIKELERRLASTQETLQRERIQREIDAAKAKKDSDEVLDEIVRDDDARVKAILKQMGMTHGDLFLTVDDRYSMQEAILDLARVHLSQQSEKHKQAIEMSVRGYSDQAIAKATGLPLQEVSNTAEHFRNIVAKQAVAKEVNAGGTFSKLIQWGKSALSELGDILFATPTADKRRNLFDDLANTKAKKRNASAQEVANAVQAILDAAIPTKSQRNSGWLHEAKWSNGKKTKKVFVPYNPEQWEHVYRVGLELSTRHSTKFDAFYEYYINMGLLSGPQTHVVNTGSNVLTAAWHYGPGWLSRATVNGLAVKDPNSEQWGELPHILAGFKAGAIPAWRNMIQAFKTENDPVAHQYLNEAVTFEFVNGDADKAGGIRAAIKGEKGRAIRIPGRFLKAMDAFAKTLIMHAETSAIAYRNAKKMKLVGAALTNYIASQVADPSSKAYQEAVTELEKVKLAEEYLTADRQKAWESGHNTALYLSLQDKNRLTEAIETMVNAGKRNKFTAVLVKLIMPFVRTPTNIYRMSVMMAGGGAARFLVRSARAGLYRYKDKDKGRVPFFDTYKKAQFIKDAAESIMATVLWSMAFAIGEGDDDDDEKMILATGSTHYGVESTGERATVNRQEGSKNLLIVRGIPFTNIKFDEEIRIPYGRFGPAALALASVVDTFRELKRWRKLGPQERNFNELGSGILGNFVAQAKEQPFLAGLAGVSESVERLAAGKAEPVDDAMKFLVTAAIPNLIRQPLRNLRDEVPDYKKGNALERALGIGPSKVNEMGRTVTRQGALGMEGVAGDIASKAIRLLFPVATNPSEALTDAAIKAWNQQSPSKAYHITPLGKSDWYLYSPLEGSKRGKYPLTDSRKITFFEKLVGLKFARDSARKLVEMGWRPNQPVTEAQIDAVRKIRTESIQAIRQKHPREFIIGTK